MILVAHNIYFIFCIILKILQTGKTAAKILKWLEK